MRIFIDSISKSFGLPPRQFEAQDDLLCRALPEAQRWPHSANPLHASTLNAWVQDPLGQFQVGSH